MNQRVVTAENLSRNFGAVRAVQGLDLEIDKGMIYGFLGPNGSGKTTAIRMLTGLLKPSSGQVHVLGYTVPKDAEKLRQHIGYMTQKFSLYDDLTVQENLEFIANIYGTPRKEQRRRIEELLSTYLLQKDRRKLAASMSGGQRQRLSLCAAVFHKPELLFLDEPTSAVDPENRREFWEQLFDLSDQGTSILVSTHYMDEAERCHKLAILEMGRKRADGSPDELMSTLGAQVVEISSANLQQIKKALLETPQIVSSAQLGSRLRVLVRDKIADPVRFLSEQPYITQSDNLSLVHPSLEDVFVIRTGKSDP